MIDGIKLFFPYLEIEKTERLFNNYTFGERLKNQIVAQKKKSVIKGNYKYLSKKKNNAIIIREAMPQLTLCTQSTC